MLSSSPQDITEQVEQMAALRATEESLELSKEKLRKLVARKAAVREEERIRISREIHDELGRVLTVLKIDLALVRDALPPCDEENLARAQEMSGRIDDAVQTVRRIATELRPPILDSGGLVPAIEWQAAEFSRRSGLRCRFRAGKVPPLGPEATTAPGRGDRPQTTLSACRKTHS